MKRLLLLLSLLSFPAWGSSITLEGSTDSLEIVTSTAASTDYTVVWSNVTATALTTPGTGAGNIASATTTTVIAAPSASNWRYVRLITLRNASTTTSNTITVQVDRSAANRTVYSTTLAAGETVVYDETGWQRYNAAGSRYFTPAETKGYNGTGYEFYKVGTASEAVGVRYSFLKDSGLPGAWVPGTPGLNGTNDDCSTTAGATVAGAPYLPNPSSGTNYLTDAQAATSVAHFLQFADLMWHNTGIVVTTTTNQAITSPTWPARDNLASTNGEGLTAALYVTTATTNAGAISNTTLSYTNSDGTASRTATMASFPATAVLGTLVPFQLQAGDRGIRSIQGITLGTSYVAGAVSLLVYNHKAALTIPVANVGSFSAPAYVAPGIRLDNGTCLFAYYTSSATTATNMSAVLSVMER